MTTQTGDTWKCDICGFRYKEKEWAEKCEAWCKEHHSCNLEITEHAEENKLQNTLFWSRNLTLNATL